MPTSASYAIDVQPWGFLRFKLTGFFDAETFARFVNDRQAAFARLTCAPNAHLTLVDLSECQLQPQLLATAFERIMADPATRSRRMAFVFGTSPTRMQVRRIVGKRDDVGLFAEEAAAMEWLTASAAEAA